MVTIVVVTMTDAANLRTKILDFRGFYSNIILDLEGWHSLAYKDFPKNVESRNLSRDNLSREIGRSMYSVGINVVARIHN